MEEEEQHSTINNNSSSNSRRLQIRRGILRQTTTLRSSPYNSSLSNLRQRRQQTSQTINHLITNIEYNTSPTDQEEIEIIDNQSLVTSDDENPNEHFEVLADFSDTSPVDLTITNENNHSDQEQNESYHSLSTVDFDPDEDDDDHRFYYTSTSIPVFDYSSSSSLSEPLVIQNNPIDMTQYRYHDEYSPLVNDDEDLSIEIILESSQNNSLSAIPIPTPRRRRSIIPSNNRGLRLSDILSIPQKIYSSLKEQINDKYNQQTTMINTQCYICLEDFQSIDSIKILNCQHVFHTGCINEWLRNHSNCAYCRTSVRIDMLRSSSSSSSTTERRQRTRARRNHNPMSRSSTNDSSQQTSIESSTSEQQ